MSCSQINKLANCRGGCNNDDPTNFFVNTTSYNISSYLVNLSVRNIPCLANLIGNQFTNPNAKRLSGSATVDYSLLNGSYILNRIPVFGGQVVPIYTICTFNTTLQETIGFVDNSAPPTCSWTRLVLSMQLSFGTCSPAGGGSPEGIVIQPSFSDQNPPITSLCGHVPWKVVLNIWVGQTGIGYPYITTCLPPPDTYGVDAVDLTCFGGGTFGGGTLFARSYCLSPYVRLHPDQPITLIACCSRDSQGHHLMLPPTITVSPLL